MALTFKPELDDSFIKWVASSYCLSDHDQVILFARKIMEYQIEKCNQTNEEGNLKMGSMQSSIMDELKEKNEELEIALINVMLWIKNWEPEFVNDGEWHDTEERVKSILTREISDKYSYYK